MAEVEKMSPKRRLTVPVDIPHIAVVHTAQLKIYKGTLERPSPSLMVALGQVLQAKSTIEHTRKWGESREENEPLGFWYDIDANLNDWLIGGQRSARFHAKVSEIACLGTRDADTRDRKATFAILMCYYFLKEAVICCYLRSASIQTRLGRNPATGMKLAGLRMVPLRSVARPTI